MESPRALAPRPRPVPPRPRRASPRPHRTLARPHRTLRRARLVALGVALVLPATLACRTLGDQLTEQERIFAVEKARTQAQRGQCEEALASLDRAQTHPDLGSFARESTRMRVRCYEALGRERLAEGHRRLLEDFYAGIDRSTPGADGSRILRAAVADSARIQGAPPALRIERPRYSPEASRARLVGRVVVAFDLTAEGEPTALRVLEMSHPLLATWAMEALTRSKLSRNASRTLLAPGRRYVTSFDFSFYWADSSDSSSTP